MQGAQLSLPVLLRYAVTFVSNVFGLKTTTNIIKNALDTTGPGILSIQSKQGGHAMVVYEYRETASEIRFYVYDSNRPQFTNPTDAALRAEQSNIHPEYVTIDKTVSNWKWSYPFTSTSTWSGTLGLGFVEASTALETPILPVSAAGILAFITGPFLGSIAVEGQDGASEVVGVTSERDLLLSDTAVPVPNFAGAEAFPDGWYFPSKNSGGFDVAAIPAHSDDDVATAEGIGISLFRNTNENNDTPGEFSLYMTAESWSEAAIFHVEFPDGEPHKANVLMDVPSELDGPASQITFLNRYGGAGTGGRPEDIRSMTFTTTGCVGPISFDVNDDNTGILVSSHYGCTISAEMGTTISSIGDDDNRACTNVPNWHDSDGITYGCAWYAEGTNCVEYGDSYENMGHTASTACCVCGGGDVNQDVVSDESLTTTVELTNIDAAAGSVINIYISEENWSAWPDDTIILVETM